MKKNAKRFFAALLAAILAVSVLPAAVFADSQADLTVSTAAQLRKFAEDVNGGNPYEGKTVVLSADIDLDSVEWTPIGTSSNPFKGTFDGGYHIVSGLSITSGSEAGLFGFVSSGTIKNLVVRGSVEGSGSIAGIVGKLSNGRIENCRNEANVSGASAVGGVVGNVDGNTTVESCVNKGSVSGTTGYIGGVTGQHWRAGTVENCYNSGAVSGPASVGGVSGGHKAASPTLKNCLNTGIVTDTAAAQNNIGAVIGGCRGGSFSNCFYIKGTGTDTKAGAEEVETVSADRLGDAFENTDGGVALKWEKNVKEDIHAETFTERTELSAKLANCIKSAISSKKATAEVEGTLLGDPSYTAGASSTDTDWMALAMGRFGWQDSTGKYQHMYDDGTGYGDYLSAMKAYIEKTYTENSGILHRVKATEWHRAVVAVAALDGDPASFGTYNESPIDLVADGSYNCVVKRGPGAQGINGWIWGLIAMDAKLTPAPADAKYSRETFITEILKMQLADGVGGNEYGGWVLGGYGASSDIDITAMAIQALAPYYNDDTVYTYTNKATGKEVSKTVRQCVNEAFDRLSAMQNAAGGFTSWNTENVESIAQVVVALCSVGIDPAKDQRFVTESGKTLLDGMLRFRLPNGGFCHTLDTPWNSMANDQATYALVSYWRFENRMRALYDMRTELSSDTAAAVDAAEKAIGSAADPASSDYKSQLKAALAAFRTVDESERRYVRNYSSLAEAIELVGGKAALDTNDAYIVSISVTKAPIKTVYTEGEKFDPAGMIVTAAFSDGTTQEITNYKIAASGALTLSDSAVYITMGPLKASVTVTVNELMPWDGKGTEESPYIIDTAEKLAAFSERVNSGKSTVGQYFALGADIDLANVTWTPAGRTPNRRFMGTFDGMGHSINNINSKFSGLFCYTGSGATVKNVCIASGSIGASNLSFIGAVVGWSYGSNIINCENRVDIVCSGWSGGIVGTVREGGTSKITGCINKGSVTASDTTAGGIVGHLDAGSNNVTVSGCCNVGAVTARDGAGGIVGSIQGSHTVKNCYNSAKITMTGNPFHGYGAIAGRMSSDTEMLNCCYNSALTDRGIYSGSDTAIAKTEDEMKSAETLAFLGDGFKADRYALVNGGYPLTYWQKTDDADKIDNVLSLIDAIGTVTEDSADKINTARNAFDDLDEALRGYVSNLPVLEAAEEALRAIRTLAEARSAAVSRLESYKNKEDYRSEEQAALADMIEEGKAAIGAAKDTEEVAAALKAAKEKIDTLKTDSRLSIEEAAADVRKKISGIGKVTIDSKDAILGARSAYNALPDEAKELVDNYDVLEAAEKALAEIEAAAKSGDPDKDQSGGKKDEDAKTSSDNTDKSDSKNNPKTGDSLYITSIVLMAAVAMCTAVFAARKKDGKKAE